MTLISAVAPIKAMTPVLSIRRSPGLTCPIKRVVQSKAKIRNSATSRKALAVLNRGNRSLTISAFQPRPDAIDPVLIELLATATDLINSPYIHKLEAYLQAEFAK